MKLFCAGVGIAVLFAATAAAQTMQTTEESKVEINDFRDVHVESALS